MFHLILHNTIFLKTLITLELDNKRFKHPLNIAIKQKKYEQDLPIYLERYHGALLINITYLNPYYFITYLLQKKILSPSKSISV